MSYPTYNVNISHDVFEALFDLAERRTKETGAFVSIGYAIGELVKAHVSERQDDLLIKIDGERLFNEIKPKISAMIQEAFRATFPPEGDYGVITTHPNT